MEGETGQDQSRAGSCRIRGATFSMSMCQARRYLGHSCALLDFHRVSMSFPVFQHSLCHVRCIHFSALLCVALHVCWWVKALQKLVTEKEKAQKAAYEDGMRPEVGDICCGCSYIFQSLPNILSTCQHPCNFLWGKIAPGSCCRDVEGEDEMVCEHDCIIEHENMSLARKYAGPYLRFTSLLILLSSETS